jgi:uncharacterized protein (TIGR02391 family)
LLLAIDDLDLVAVKSGFSSGYSGEGPRTLSYVLEVLRALQVEIDEYDVTEDVLHRIDASALTQEDLQWIKESQPVRPPRWYSYVWDRHEDMHKAGQLWKEFPNTVPLSIIDTYIVDLAISFWSAPDERLLTGYRRLEDNVRERTGIPEHGAKLFSQAFLGPNAKLHWADASGAERDGRANLFAGAFMAFRNPRAHREREDDPADQLADFLLLNQLFRLEREAKVTSP